MSVIPSQPYALPPKLIVKTAMEFAAEFWEIVKMDGSHPVTVTQEAYAKQAWPQFLDHARNALTDMLSGDYPESMKQEIYQAFIEEREAAARAAQKFMSKGSPLIH